MARPNPKITARMRARGFVPIGAAAKASGQPRTTLSGWVKSRRVRGVKIGSFTFVESASLKRALEPKEI